MTADVNEAFNFLRAILGGHDIALSTRHVPEIMAAWKLLDSSITEGDDFPDEWDGRECGHPCTCEMCG